MTKTFEFSSNILLEYKEFGKGNHIILAFHGFGQNADVYRPVADAISDDFKIISFNLFFHEGSRFDEQIKYLRNSKWKKILSAFLKSLEIDRFSVVGYSLGGRFAQSTLVSFDDRIDHFILLAPDAIVQRKSYQIATAPGLGQPLFSFVMNNEKWFFKGLGIIEKSPFMKPALAKFASSQLQTPDQRQRVFKSWITFKYLKATQKQLIELLNNKSIKSTFIFGKHDSVIDPKRHFYFLNKLSDSKVFVLACGHHKLIDKSANMIASLLKPEGLQTKKT